MIQSLKHKARLLFTAAGLTAVLLTASSPALVAASPVDNVAWGKITCDPNTEIVVEGKTCCPKGVASTQKNPSSCLFAKYVNPLIALLSAAVGVVVVISIITGAIQFSSSAGDPQKAANAKNKIRNALLGLLAYLLLYAFLQFIVPGGKFNA